MIRKHDAFLPSIESPTRNIFAIIMFTIMMMKMLRLIVFFHVSTGPLCFHMM